MDCKDLMVGDWVNYKSPSSGKLQPIKIANIYGCEFNCEVVGNVFDNPELMKGGQK